MYENTDIKKVEDNIYEVQKQKNMNVPVRLFASKKILEKLKQDKSLEQGMNVATLPGIYGASIMMPDAHQGYGCPVGGVAAFDVENGLISPGVIGFDINCILPGTKVTLANGSTRVIEDFEADFVEITSGNLVMKAKQVNLLSLGTNFEAKEALYFMKKKYRGTIVILETASGNQLKVTSDHPILTKNGMKHADALTFGELVAVQERKELTFSPIVALKEEEYCGLVYDFTVEDTHNFIANNIVVSNCGVRLLQTNLSKQEVNGQIEELLERIFNKVPCGVGKESDIKLSQEELGEVLEKGAEWALQNGYAEKEDLTFSEENGKLVNADPALVSKRAKKRGKNQLGTLGAGNHFMEIQYVDEIYDKEAAAAMGITEKNQICAMIHCGSRGLGHQVCSDYIRKMEEENPKLADSLVDRNLIYAPAQSPLSKQYFKAMNAAANFAWCNRQIIAHRIRESFKELFPSAQVRQVYDIAHNIAKMEEHTVDGESKKVYVHRKGATRAFPPGSKVIPEQYKKYGQPILLPGSMGTASYVLVGGKRSMDLSFGSTAHGAGRVMSRRRAKELFRGEKVKAELKHQNIHVKAASWKGISEEAPGVYKDVDEVVKISDEVGIGKLVVRLRPLGVVKG